MKIITQGSLILGQKRNIQIRQNVSPPRKKYKIVTV